MDIVNLDPRILFAKVAVGEVPCALFWDSAELAGTSMDYEIRIVTEEDTEAVLELLKKNFFLDEPLNDYVKLIEFKDSTCEELEQFCKEKIHEKNSVMAITPSGQILGVSLNGTLEEDYGDVEQCQNPKFKKILKLLNHCAKIFQPIFNERFPKSSKVLNIRVLSSDSAWRGQGIAGALIKRSRQIAQEQGYDLIRVDCSSHFSARAVSKLGYELVYELKYEDYKDNGEVVFKLPHPHTCVAFFIQSTTSP
ncbi:hypothetical protein PPYR_07351 [Photinus pyralis]|uniref:aralkylamine N-acetyltransferase n=2 Tax=Photinus pyralis TaxID=7054 RepID=A0A5N4AQ86_PHOPY|nr:dopamine N-acetyltransferase-like isoform X1 [Photinus pyralis]KAB0799471.1 hypothetical protein PPYR_07351 [Photinus pyralis]